MDVIAFAISLWLGLYLLRQSQVELTQADTLPVGAASQTTAAVQWAASGLLSYALVLPLITLWTDATLREMLVLLPLLGWLISIWSLRERLMQLLGRQQASTPLGTPRSVTAQRSAAGLVLFASICFGLAIALWFLARSRFPESLVLLAIAADLLVFGYAVGVLDAFEQGERFTLPFARSGMEAALLALFVGVQVVFIGRLRGAEFAQLTPLLYSLVATVVVLQVWADAIHVFFDRLVFGRRSSVPTERAALRSAAESVSKRPLPAPDFDETTFIKQTRRALSNMSNLPKLAGSPLLELPLIDGRLQEKGIDPNTLARSAELRALLTESIQTLKPSEESEFETADAWRYYNALYFPYVRGLRPWSRRALVDQLDTADAAAMAWFRGEVAPRTLYNWQNKAAELIARDLLERQKPS